MLPEEETWHKHFRVCRPDPEPLLRHWMCSNVLHERGLARSSFTGNPENTLTTLEPLQEIWRR
jgi:hypothetical protein